MPLAPSPPPRTPHRSRCGNPAPTSRTHPTSQIRVHFLTEQNNISNIFPRLLALREARPVTPAPTTHKKRALARTSFSLSLDCQINKIVAGRLYKLLDFIHSFPRLAAHSLIHSSLQLKGASPSGAATTGAINHQGCG